MDEACARIRASLMDSIDGRGQCTGEALEHMASCPGCREFGALLSSLSGPAASGSASQASYLAADLAIEKAEAVRSKRSGARRFAGFLALSSAFLSGLALAGASGHGIWVLGFQAAGFLALPFLGLALLRRRMQGDAQWT